MTKKELNEFCKTHFHHCGCGCPEGVATLIRDVILSFRQDAPDDDRKKLLPGVYGDNYNYAEWFLLYQLDAAGLLDHGVNIRWSWLTALGIDFVKALQTYDEWLELMTDSVAFYSDNEPIIMNDGEPGAIIENWDVIACRWCEELVERHVMLTHENVCASAATNTEKNSQ